MQRLIAELRSRLQYKLVLPFVLLTMLVTFVGGSAAYWMTTSSLQERFDNQHATITRLASDSLVNQEQSHLQFLREVTSAQSNPSTAAPSVADALNAGDSEGMALAYLTPFFWLDLAVPRSTSIG
ncbi:MAG: hypothetical protein HC828_16590 [Blastochloris sp.]|nr:hypothetical protein [Blastochloris sp.]